MPSVTSRRATPSPVPAFEIRRSAIAGAGAYALRLIKKGEKIIEYVGERVSHPVADARYDDAAEHDHHTFLFAVSSRTVIDATVGGNDSRFINHSCEPNCETEIEKGRVFVFALRDIKVGEELAYDYAYERDGTETEKEERYYKCLCGSPMCRGTIMEPKSELLKRQRAKQRALAKKRKAVKKKTKAKKPSKR
ncbi:MAG: SET domain-containing protein-lysine N-methyltransferase [Gemmatimonadaceae bacterium]|nr:SET domain-containing protein-lysine N-methyltransferase [Gemmatimonadaceae bacterium]